MATSRQEGRTLSARSKGGLRDWARRQGAIDRAAAIALLPPVACLLLLLLPVLLVIQGRPLFHGSVRMKSPTDRFHLWKIRTMIESDGPGAEAVLGGGDAGRVTALGRFLRSSRLDELPQIFNVLRGDIGFIGPRPPLPRYVADFPELYERVLRDRPGITGLSTVMLHGREHRILGSCRTREEADEVYRRRCIPIKARLDIIYQKRKSPALNAMILWRTIARLLPASARGRHHHRKREGSGSGRLALKRDESIASNAH